MLLRPYHLLLLSIWICLVLSQDPASSSDDPPSSTGDAPSSTAAAVLSSTEDDTTTVNPAMNADLGIYFPLMAVSENQLNPIGVVQSKSGNMQTDFDFRCQGPNDLSEMDPWSKTGSGKKKIKLYCNMDSTYYAEIGAAATTTSNCKIYLGCELDSTNTCKKLPTWETTSPDGKGRGTVDPFCIYNKDLDLIPRHRWNNQETLMRKIGLLYAKNFPKPPGDLYVQMPVKHEYSGLSGVYVDTDRFLGHVLYSKDRPSRANGNDVPCKDGCHYGRNIIIDTEQGEMEIMVHLKRTCDWFTVCTDWKEEYQCKYRCMVNVMVRNGFVAFDSRRDQALLKMVRSPKDSGTSTGPVEDSLTRVDLTILSPNNYKDQTGDNSESSKYAHMAVTSSWRQRVIGRIHPGEKMMLTFPSADCLHETFGLRANKETSVYVYDYEKDKDNYRADVVDKNKNNPKFEADTTVQIERIGTVVEIEEASTVTQAAEKDETAVDTTTPMFTMGPGALVEVKGKTTDPLAEEPKWEGQSTWAIFYGWLIGSFAAMICMAPAMFLMRRMLYGSWYRGMYKRYGCDASGATGGVTGAAFGGPGDQTTGMQTVGTQMGATGSDTSTMQTSQQTSQMSQVSQVTRTGGGGDTTGSTK